MSRERTLALIPARAGSRRLPEKNRRPFLGKPLLEWAIETARACPSVDRVAVSTDCPRLREIALAAGAEAPWLRPIELATDETPMSAVVLHALRSFPDLPRVVLLQPTSPLRLVADVEATLALLTRAPSAASVCAAPVTADQLFDCEPGGAPMPACVARPRDHLWTLNGAVYAFRAAAFRADPRFVTPSTRFYAMPVERSVDIDDAGDWREAEWRFGGAT